MKKTNIVYDPAFKADAVLKSYEINNLTKFEQELGLYEGALNRWRKAFEKNGRDGFTKKVSSKKMKGNYKVLQLEKKIKKTELEFEILQKAGAYVKMGKPGIFQFMDDNEKIYSIRTMSKILAVGRCTYRRWKNRFNTDTYKTKIRIQEEIRFIFSVSGQCYGKDRIAAALQNTGYKISASTVGKYMKELGLNASIKKNPK